MTAAPRKRLLTTLVWIAAAGATVVAAYVYYSWFRASLQVTSQPSSAEVRIDGRLVGRTPLTGQAVSPGLHSMDVSHSHYAIHRQQFQAEAGQNVEVHVTLERGLGELVLYSNPRGAWVEVDGRRRPGRTPLVLRLPSGPHEIAMGMEERRAVTEQVVVAADQSRELRLVLDMDPHGNLVVETTPPEARVSLPGVERDYQPDVRLPVGEYLVRVAHPGYHPRDVRLQVRYGDNRHRVTLTRAMAELRVSSEPADARVRVRYRAAPDGRLRWHELRSGLQVPVGEVEVRASAMGRRSVYRRVAVAPSGSSLHLRLEPMEVTAGSRIRDPMEGDGKAPAMVVVPPGEFVMGSDDGPPSERPARRVVLSEPFAVSVTEVTAADYRRFLHATEAPVDPRLAEAPDHVPATRMTFQEALAYAEWLSAETGARYRLPSEPEWEYMARGGSPAAYSFGDDADALCAHANVADQSMRRRYEGYGTADCDDGFAELAPVASFPPNGFGVHDVHGNVAEWVMECAMPSYADAPDDGTPVDASARCPTHGVRGGSWDDAISDVRLGKRNVASSASADRGIRLLREL